MTMNATVTCPTATQYRDQAGKIHTHTTIGCGATVPNVPDDEGFIDCPMCGIFFTLDTLDHEDVIE